MFNLIYLTIQAIDGAGGLESPVGEFLSSLFSTAAPEGQENMFQVSVVFKLEQVVFVSFPNGSFVFKHAGGPHTAFEHSEERIAPVFFIPYKLITKIV